MSITGAHLLTIAEAVANKAALASTLDYVLPSPFKFTSKADFWAQIDNDQDTKTEIETELIRAAWLKYLRFEDTAGENENAQQIDGPIKTLIYEITLFAESRLDRLDETITPDDFNKLIKKTNHEHVTAIMELCGEFQGVDALSGMSAFAVAETQSLTQTDNTQTDVECEFIPGAIGDQTKLECRVNIQLPC